MLDDDVPMYKQVQKYFRSLLDQNITTFTAETNMLTTLDSERKGSFTNFCL